MIFESDNILKGLREGDKFCFETLYNNFFSPLCSYGYNYISEEDTVADIVQEIFIKTWERRDNFYSLLGFKSFLYTSVKNACLNELRNRNGKKYISISENINYIDEDLIIKEEVHRLISQEILNLPPKMRKIFELTLQDYSIKDIAESLNIAESTVKNQRVTARKKLKIKLKGYYYLFFF